MARHTIDMTGLTTKDFLVNFRRGEQYHNTIQNASGQSAAITVTNAPMGTADEVAAAPFTNPVGGALNIANGGIDQLDEPYVALRITLGAPGSGPIYIAEAG